VNLIITDDGSSDEKLEVYRTEGACIEVVPKGGSTSSGRDDHPAAADVA